MEQVDFSFMGEGVKVIQEHLTMTVIIIGIAAIGSFVLFKYLRIPRFIANILMWLIVAVVSITTLLYYYLPGIINGST